MIKKQTVRQRKEVKRRVASLEEITARAAERQARHEIGPRWGWPRLGLLLVIMGLWLTFAELSGVRDVVADYLLKEEYRTGATLDWFAALSYGFSFAMTLAAFWFGMRWIDKKEEVQVEERTAVIIKHYYEALAEQENE